MDRGAVSTVTIGVFDMSIITPTLTLRISGASSGYDNNPTLLTMTSPLPQTIILTGSLKTPEGTPLAGKKIHLKIWTGGLWLDVPGIEPATTDAAGAYLIEALLDPNVIATGPIIDGLKGATFDVAYNGD
jgi:hypothetical protein